jgi:site-specific recombinase XerD
MLLAKTGSLRFVQKQLGHSSVTTTSLYADVLPEMNQRLAEAILK